MNNKLLSLALGALLLGSTVPTVANPVKVKMNAISTTMTLSDPVTGHVIDAGQPSNNEYDFDVPVGKYLLSGYNKDGVTFNGSILINVADSATVQQFTVLTCTAYVTNKNADNSVWTIENGDYSLDVNVSSREGSVQKVPLGKSTTANRYTFLALNGNSYYATFTPSEAHQAEGFTTFYKSATLTGNVNVNGAIPKGENYVISVPEEASFELNIKFAHFVNFTPVEPLKVETADGKTNYTYYLAHGQVYNYRTGMAGKLTRAGYFTMSADAAKRPAIAFDTADYETADPHLINHSVSACGGYETGNIFLNINERGHLKLNQGQSFNLHAMRSWQLTDNSTNNYFMEPDFHYSVISVDGRPSTDVVEIRQTPGSAWAELNAVGNGTALVLVTYDAIGLNFYSGNDRKDYMGGEIWGAIWPENTGVFVVTVGSADSAVEPNMLINQDYNTGALKLAGSSVDAEHDVFYYLDSEPGAVYTFTPVGAVSVEMARPEIGERMASYSGFSSDGVTLNDDGSYSLLLTDGRQIVRLTDAAGNSVYQVLTARSCHRELINTSRPGSMIFQPGDEVKIQYSGLFHPANKLAGIYNMSAYVTYNGVPNGSSLILGSGQYTFGSAPSAQAVTVTIPADHDVDAQPSIRMTDGVIQVNGYGDPIGNHRTIDNIAGRSPNFTAVPHKTYFGMIPDVEIPISKTRSFQIRTESNVADADIRMLFNGTELTPDEDGLYSGTYGNYELTAMLPGYRCFRHTFNIPDNAEGLQIFPIDMVEVPGGWDGVTLTEPLANPEGVYQIATPAELAWLADKVNSEGGAPEAELIADIDLADYEWTPIGGTFAKCFAGTFNGNNHKVDGLYINTPNAQYGGLFGYVKGASADAPASISNLSVSGSVTAKAYAAGIAGCIQAYVTVDRCANMADVAITGNYAGGIVGFAAQATDRISNCYNTGSITGTQYCGGILGGHSNKAVCVENVFSIGSISCNNLGGACIGSSTAKDNVSNVFAIENYSVTAGHELVTDAQLRSGEVAYRLGEAFGQTIGEDPHPVLGGRQVFFDPEHDLYFNEGDNTSIDEVSAADEIEGYYSLSGLRLAGPVHGVNIVRFRNGKVRKVIL